MSAAAPHRSAVMDPRTERPPPAATSAGPAPPRRQDAIGTITWRGLRRLLDGLPVAALAPERGASPPAETGATGDGPILVASAASAAAAAWLRRAPAPQRLALHAPTGQGAAARLLAGELCAAGSRVVLLAEDEEVAGAAANIPVVAMPNPALLAGAPTAERLDDPFALGERPGKRRALALFHDPLAPMRRAAHPREVAYQEYLRWELARWLDGLAEKFDLHWVALRSGPGQDDNKANLDVAMRMRRYAATHVHPAALGLPGLLAGMRGARLIVTSHPEVAYLALARGVPPLLVGAATPAHARFVADGFGELAFEPYAFTAEAAQARVARLFMDESVRKAALVRRDAALDAASAMVGPAVGAALGVEVGAR